MPIGPSFFSEAGGAVSDLFAEQGAQVKAQYDLSEQQEYTLASQQALQNEQFTKMSTAIQESQENRQITQSLGRTQAQVAGAGFAQSGSSLDILRSSAQQGAITKAVTSEQGLITEAGYQEQAASYQLMASAAGNAAKGEEEGGIGDLIGAGIQVAGMALAFA